jgi:outer membrane protein assembly factor BamB
MATHQPGLISGVDRNGIIFVVGKSSLYAINSTQGSTLWSFALRDKVSSHDSELKIILKLTSYALR